MPDAVGHDLVEAEAQLGGPAASAATHELGVEERLAAGEAEESRCPSAWASSRNRRARRDVEPVGPLDRHAAVRAGQVALVRAGEGQVVRAEPAAGFAPPALADRPFACRETVRHRHSDPPTGRHNRHDRKISQVRRPTLPMMRMTPPRASEPPMNVRARVLATLLAGLGTAAPLFADEGWVPHRRTPASGGVRQAGHEVTARRPCSRRVTVDLPEVPKIPAPRPTPGPGRRGRSAAGARRPGRAAPGTDAARRPTAAGRPDPARGARPAGPAAPVRHLPGRGCGPRSPTSSGGTAGPRCRRWSPPGPPPTRPPGPSASRAPASCTAAARPPASGPTASGSGSAGRSRGRPTGGRSAGSTPSRRRAGRRSGPATSPSWPAHSTTPSPAPRPVSSSAWPGWWTGSSPSAPGRRCGASKPTPPCGPATRGPPSSASGTWS